MFFSPSSRCASSGKEGEMVWLKSIGAGILVMVAFAILASFAALFHSDLAPVKRSHLVQSWRRAT